MSISKSLTHRGCFFECQGLEGKDSHRKQDLITKRLWTQIRLPHCYNVWAKTGKQTSLKDHIVCIPSKQLRDRSKSAITVEKELVSVTYTDLGDMIRQQCQVFRIILERKKTQSCSRITRHRLTDSTPALRSWLLHLAGNRVQPDIGQQLDWVTVDWRLIAQISISVKRTDRCLSPLSHFSAPVDSN